MAENDHAPDHALLSRYRRGHDDAATQLYLKYARRLRGLAEAKTGLDLRKRTDPDDIVQSVFRTFFRRVARGEYSVPEGSELWNLFLVIALNKIRKAGVRHHAARRDARRTVSVDESDAAATQAEDTAALHSLRLAIDDVLTGLPEDMSEVVRLRIEGHEVGEIAARTGRARRSVERMLQTFRSALATELERE